jgi:DNA-binding MarR family transcriptional regulator
MSTSTPGPDGKPAAASAPVALEEVMRAAEFRRLLRRFLAHGDLRVRQAGLTPQRYLLLLAIKGAPDGSQARSIGQLTDDLQLAQSSVTELVDRAEAARLVARASGSADARTVLVRLSPAGEERLSRALLSVRADREQLLAHLDRARLHL